MIHVYILYQIKKLFSNLIEYSSNHISSYMKYGKYCLEVDDAASEESLKDHLFATNQYWNFHDALLDDVNIIDFLTLLYERVIFIPFESDAAKDDFVEDSVCVFEMLEKGQLLKGILDEAHVLVFVIKDAFLEVLADKRVF